jgi:hypothetical protein
VEEDIAFLCWLKQRLVHYHKYDHNDSILVKFNSIIDRFSHKKDLSISNDDLDKILSKYYVDFYLEKSGDDQFKIGYNNQERRKLRELIRNLVTDIINVNIPDKPIIKDN